MDITTLRSHFPNTFIESNHPLAPYTTVKIGGPADIFIHTKTSAEFIEVLKFISCQQDQGVMNHAPTILGNGSNVLISDSGIRGIVIKNSANNIEFLPNNQVKVDSGVQLPLLINQLTEHALSGLEEFAYIPSSIGGAVYGNIHGVNKNNFDKFLSKITVFDIATSDIKIFNTNQLEWGYDYSSLQNKKNLIIIDCILQLLPGDSNQSRQLVNEIITKKTTSQSMNSLGCVFKNPDSDSAGRIIDQELGLKGFQIGQAQISPKHANFIVNLGGATATDYYAIIQTIITQSKAKGFDLYPEIKFLGDFSQS